MISSNDQYLFNPIQFHEYNNIIGAPVIRLQNNLQIEDVRNE